MFHPQLSFFRSRPNGSHLLLSSFVLLFLFVVVESCRSSQEVQEVTESNLEERGKSELEDFGLDTIWLDSFEVIQGLTSGFDHIIHKDPLSYLHDPQYPNHRPKRVIRCNVHFMYDSLGRHNFDIEKVGINSWQVENLMNEHMRANKKMNLPEGNNTPVLDLPFRLRKHKQKQWPGDVGGYAHKDQDLFYFIGVGKHKNNYSRDVIREYSIGLDTILNIFLLPHHPDSTASPTYPAHSMGIALGHALKVAGLYEAGALWKGKGIMVHELGHILGLSHSWHNDGCDDTPKHPNCWNRTKNPPCDGAVSNNVMDYNSTQNAWTPCQIGKVMRNISTIKSRVRPLIEPDWCHKNPERNITITDTIEWRGDRDIDGDITIDSAGVLKIYCRVSLPQDASILVRKGGTLILDRARLHNSCGDQWQGIQIERAGPSQGLCQVLPGTVIEDAIHGELAKVQK